MRTKKAQHEKNILEIIRKNKVMFISHIFGYYGQISRQYFYQIGLDKSDEIKKAIADNRAKATGFMINKWIASDNPTLQVCAYKILCSDDERKRLSKDYVEVTGKDGKDLNQKIEVEIIDKLSNDENSDK